MPLITISLLGKFKVLCQDRLVPDLDKIKVQELFSYLLLHRDQAHTREALATLLWGEISLVQAKRYLRKTLWQLQTPLDQHLPLRAKKTLVVQPDWIQVNPEADICLDVADIEAAFAACQGIPGYQLTTKDVALLQNATSLYKGNLLEGWFQDWCLYERERLQRIYLIILDKLIEYCIFQGQFDKGIEYSLQVLGFDTARERIHLNLMRLYYLSGDRTQALRQFEQCEAILKREFDVQPSRHTMTLYKQILEDQSVSLISSENEFAFTYSREQDQILAAHQLKQLQTDLEHMQIRLETMNQLLQTLVEFEDRTQIRPG
jgi:DNA-binding SARP family transcriptional activator